jgi:hypothetical protein
LASSAVYIFNDWRDIQSDQLRKSRPPYGRVQVPRAAVRRHRAGERRITEAKVFRPATISRLDSMLTALTGGTIVVYLLFCVLDYGIAPFDAGVLIR